MKNRFSIWCGSLLSIWTAISIEPVEAKERQPAPSCCCPPEEILTYSDPCSPCPDPWFTGPLLTSSGHVIPAGYIDLEPYVFLNVKTGDYDGNWHGVSSPKFYNFNFQVPVFVGLTEWMDIIVSPQVSWNLTHNVSDMVFNDLPIEIDFQILKDTRTNSIPGLKVYVQENFPTGRFDRFSPEKFGTDGGGSGSFITSTGFVITRLVELWNCHFLAWRVNGFFGFPSKVDVRGLNTYGGAIDTRAKVRPGTFWGGLAGFELTMNQNWVLALDLVGAYQNKTTYTGFAGTNRDGSPAILGGPSSTRFSIAPAIEYNFSSAFGIIGGAWFSVAGRNTPRFISGVIAVNYFGSLFNEQPKRIGLRTGGRSSPGSHGGAR